MARLNAHRARRSRLAAARRPAFCRPEP